LSTTILSGSPTAAASSSRKRATRSPLIEVSTRMPGDHRLNSATTFSVRNHAEAAGDVGRLGASIDLAEGADDLLVGELTLAVHGSSPK
jgi:hypothetical protein